MTESKRSLVTTNLRPGRSGGADGVFPPARTGRGADVGRHGCPAVAKDWRRAPESTPGSDHVLDQDHSEPGRVANFSIDGNWSRSGQRYGEFAMEGSERPTRTTRRMRPTSRTSALSQRRHQTSCAGVGRLSLAPPADWAVSGAPSQIQRPRCDASSRRRRDDDSGQTIAPGHEA